MTSIFHHRIPECVDTSRTQRRPDLVIFFHILTTHIFRVEHPLSIEH